MVKEGYIIDYISGLEVKATPEEIEAVQVYSKILVEDKGYPRNLIVTHPQHRVKVRPSDRKKEYPVDIAVFNNSIDDDNILIVVECKKKNRNDGITQLKDYLRFCKADFGVWFNGNASQCIRKIEKNGRVDFVEIPGIPNYGQRIEDVGMYKRCDLKPTHNLKTTFKAIRNHLAANNVGATRDEILAQQLINLIFCKIYDERFTKPDEILTFRAGIDESDNEVVKRITQLFDLVRRKYKDVIDEDDKITLDPKSVVYVVGELQNYCLIDTERDVIADAFEVFIGHSLKGDEGQFFTPRNVVKMIVDIIDPSDEDMIIDPACGTGGFLVESLRHVWNQLDEEGIRYGWNDENLHEEKMEVAIGKIRGIDKDSFLSKIAKAYMAILGDGKSGIFCEDSLNIISEWSDKTRFKVDMGIFSVVLTNPPFGSKIPVRGEEKLKQYDLGYKWSKDKKTGQWSKGSLKDKESPQVLFIERCIQLLRFGGRMGIVLPDGIFGNDTAGYIREWLKKQGRIIAVIDLPLETFSPNTTTKTSVLIFEKRKPEDIPNDYEIFMAIADSCGHDRRGGETEEDDIIEIAPKYKEWAKKQNDLLFRDEHIIGG